MHVHTHFKTCCVVKDDLAFLIILPLSLSWVQELEAWSTMASLWGVREWTQGYMLSESSVDWSCSLVLHISTHAIFNQANIRSSFTNLSWILCYRLNVCLHCYSSYILHRTLIYWSPNFQCNGAWGGAFGKQDYLRSGSWTPVTGLGISWKLPCG